MIVLVYCSALVQLVFKNQGIEGDVPLHAAGVEKLHQFGQVGFGKILSAHSRIELFQAKIDGIGAIFDGGFTHSQSPAGASNSGRRIAGDGTGGDSPFSSTVGSGSKPI